MTRQGHDLVAKRPPTGSWNNGKNGTDESIDADPAKIQLAMRIAEAIEARGLTQAATAALLGIDQPKVSRLLRNHLSEFSVSRLLRFITLLGRDVEIVIHATREDASGQPGRLRVVAINWANL